MSHCEVRLPTWPGRAILQTFASRWAWGRRDKPGFSQLVFRLLMLRVLVLVLAVL